MPPMWHHTEPRKVLSHLLEGAPHVRQEALTRSPWQRRKAGLLWIMRAGAG